LWARFHVTRLYITLNLAGRIRCDIFIYGFPAQNQKPTGTSIIEMMKVEPLDKMGSFFIV
jgi:hypothetical protein